MIPVQGPGGMAGAPAERLSVVFLGSSAFAEPVLRVLHRFHRVIGVATQPDRPAGRNHRLKASRIKRLALELQLPFWQPEKIRRRSGWEPLAELAPDCVVVADYGQILPARFLAAPRLGAVNVHASLLPELRGAAPAVWAIARGFRTTGVTTMLMDAGLDTGPLLLQRETAITEDETGGQLLDRLAPMGAELLIETLAGLAAGRITPRPQDDRAATFAPRLGKADAALDWAQSAAALANRVRALSPAPVAFTAMAEGTEPAEKRLVRIHRAAADPAPGPAGLLPGSLRITGTPKTPALAVACAGGTTLLPLEVQAAGRRRLPIADFLRGAGLSPREASGNGTAGGAGRFLGAEEAAQLAETR